MHVRRERQSRRLVALVHTAREGLVIALLGSLACTSSSPPKAAVPPTPRTADGRIARVSLGQIASPVITATAAWRLVDDAGKAVARGDAGERRSLNSAGGVLRVIEQGGASRVAGSRLVLSTDGAGVVSINGRRYRGDVSLIAGDSAGRRGDRRNGRPRPHVRRTGRQRAVLLHLRWKLRGAVRAVALAKRAV